MKFVIVFCALLGVVFPYAFHDNFASVKLNGVDLEQELLNNQVFHQHGEPDRVINGFYEAPLNHFSPVDSRRLRLVSHSKKFIILII